VTYRHRFDGQIAGLGSSSGARIVIGRWTDSPFGNFCDVMLQDSDEIRWLLAPSDVVAEFVSETYQFDRVRIGTVGWQEDGDRRVLTAPGLTLSFVLGGRTPIGALLSLLPRRLTTSPGWARSVAPVARLLLPGVSTTGSARDGRREFYGAFDVRRISSATGEWQGRDLGVLTAVDPPVTFGFGSTPRTPSLTSLVTTIDEVG
jgi:hypothetical protein